MNTEIISRIKKLLKLTESTNENEAKAAMLRVQRLLMKHKLTMNEINNAESSNEEKGVVETSSDITYANSTWKSFLGKIISDNFNCCYFVSKDGRKKTVHFIGKEDDVEVCKATFRYAVQCADSKIKKLKYQRKKEKCSTKNIDMAYGMGFCRGLKSAFETQVQENKEKWSLVLCTPEDVMAAYNKLNLKTKKVKTKIDFSNAPIYNKGIKDGKSFNMRSKISEKDGFSA